VAFIIYALFKVIRRKLCKPNYEGKTVWITGASSGIGEYLAYEFSKHGAALILSARNKAELERVKSSCKNAELVKVVQLDMTNFSDVEKISG
jgi:short-subunit dehydrogenase